MPLAETVHFKARLQKGNRVQIPRPIRWRFKLETDEILHVVVSPVYAFVKESFYCSMTKDGRLTIPKLIVETLCDRLETPLEPGDPLSVTLYGSAEE